MTTHLIASFPELDLWDGTSSQGAKKQIHPLPNLVGTDLNDLNPNLNKQLQTQ